MSGKLAAEIGQKKPFDSLEEEALLNLARTNEVIQQKMTDFLKQFQLTRTQYNVLRIMRGAGCEGVTCSQAAERMIAADPDITRLMDRLETRKLIARERSKEDRRVVVGRITPDGLDLLKTIDKPLADHVKDNYGNLGKERLSALIEILETLRAG